MGKVPKALMTAFVAGLLFLMMALPASAAPSVSEPMACWNNCGIGGIDAKTY